MKSSSSDTSETAELVARIFKALNAMYMSRWKAHFVDQAAIDDWRATWAAALGHEKITEEQVRYALRVCSSKYAWPPSSAEFIALCQSTPLPQPPALSPPKMTREQRMEGLKRLRLAAEQLQKASRM